MGEIQQITPHVVLVPSPGMGHLIPFIEFAKRLVFHHGFSVTFLIPTHHSPSKAEETVLNSLPKSITYIFLPPVNLDDISKESMMETLVSAIVNRSKSSLSDAIKNMIGYMPVVALVVDLFGADLIDVAKEFDLHFYMFYTTNAMVLSMCLEIQNLDKKYTCKYQDITETIKLPGCVAFHGGDLPDPTQDRQDEAYQWYLNCSKQYRFYDGILVNSFLDIESGAFKALNESKPPVYPIGPLIRTDPDGSENECLKWLDNQPHESVLFVSFGSGGTLSSEQLIELAFGLEMSEQRFLWVVRSPSEKAAGAYFNSKSSTNPFDFLPKGFVERTKGVGLVVPSWAPQVRVLGHDSTGGFLTHCGWNSTLESVVHGVPLIAWPLYAEQRMNARMLDEMKLALRPKFGEDGIICREEIAKVVKGLMEGEEGKMLRCKMKELKVAAGEVLSQDGSSTKSLCEVAVKWKVQK